MASALSSALIAVSATVVPVSGINANAASKYMLEYLDRGICAVNTGSGMLVSWRYLANDDDNATYKLYRDGTLIYTSESGKSTCYLDKSGNSGSKYRVDTFSGNALMSSEDCKLISNNAYFDVPLNPPTASGVTYSPNDMSVGDVDGDGQYELFLKWDPDNSKDNSQKGKTGNVFIDCIRLDGTRLWRIDLGQNIRAGAHYTQFYVADFDLDGKAEMTCKTADGTVDGTGKVIGDASKDYRNSDGYVLSGPEYYTLFDGATGAILDTVNYKPARGTVSNWGDKYGNRVDRFWGTVAYLDGVHPCVVTGRGYYTRMTATAYTVENKKLKELWAFDTGNNSSAAGYGDGNHNSMPADVDGDGRQEVITGATVIDDNGTVYYNTNQGHGDAMHVGDLDPTNSGLEAWICHEEKSSGYGVSLLDLDQKKIIYHQNGAGDTGRCCADNVWAGNPGAECWGNKNSNNETPVVDTKGNVLNCRRPAINFLSYWDGDLEREILDGYTDSPATISKMTGEAGKTTITNLLTTDGYYTCNTTKGTPCLSADIFGDWREELIVRAANHKSVRIYCT
ncbi:MAG: rhamnogalacturonan lyase, partial [Ruminococcus sp.]|nr:rhamnogalacturonan lyase [Ruminococcus sp.]